jgi:acyl-CoA reductase-like NAD-dependent aldehyde dehydrogenase
LGQTAGAALSQHPGVAKIAFTGSTEVGRAIQRAAATHLKRVSLELGGKSPLILFDDTGDLDAAAQAALWAIFANSGQNCVAGSRLFLQAGIHDAVVDRLAALAGRLTVGPGLEAASDLGPLISASQLDRVLGFIAEGSRAGGHLIAGGHRLGGRLSQGYFVEPTIFAGLGDESAVASQEIFGPVLSVFRFEHEEEVLARANALPYGLAAGVWTQNLGRAHRMAARLKAGVVWVNTYDWFDPAVPFGGMGESGLGRELGRPVMEAYTELKSVWVKIE